MRRLWIVVGTVFGLLLGAAGGVLFVLHTESGSRWLVERVRGRLPADLTFQSFSGTAAGPFELLGVEYSVGPIRLRVERAQVSWQPWRLLDNTVWLDSVRVTGARAWWDTTSAAARTEEALDASPDSGAAWNVNWGELVVSGGVFEGRHGFSLYDVELVSRGALDSFSVQVNALATVDTIPGIQVQSVGRGDMEGMVFDQVELVRDSTRLVGTGEVAWKPQPAWHATALVTDLNPADWSAHAGRLEGNVRLSGMTEGTVERGVVSYTIRVDTLSGTLAGSPVSGQASLWVSADTVRTDSAWIEWGGLVARARGVVADTVHVTWEADVPDLSLWSDRSSGNLHAQGEAHGPKGALNVQAEVSGGRLRFDGHSVDRVAAVLDLAEGGGLPSRLSLTAHEALLWGEALDTIALEAEGTLSSHTASAHTSGPAGSGRLKLNGGYDSLWNGHLEELQVSMDSLGSWRLLQPAVALVGRDTLSLSSLCLAGTGGQFCLDMKADTSGAWQLLARLDSVATDWMCRLAPYNFMFDSKLSGIVRVDASETDGFIAEAHVTATPGRFIQAAHPTDTIVSDTIHLDLNWTPQSGQLSAGGEIALRGERTPFSLKAELPGTEVALSHLRADSIEWRALEWSGVLDVKPLSLAWLDPTLPEGTHLDGQAALHLAARTGPQGTLLGDCTIQLPPGRMSVWTGTDTLNLDWSASLFSLRADSTGLVARAQSALTMDGQAVGTLELDVRSESSFALGEDPYTLPMQGTVTAQLDLAPLQPFVVGVSGLSGSFHVGATLAGTLGELDVEGSLELAAEAFLPDLGIQLTQVKLNMNAAGGRTAVTGSARSGGGSLELSGDVSRLPSRESPSRLRVKGSNFLASDTRQVRVWLSPDLELAMFGDSLDLSGRIDVPKANIEISRLPEQAVAVSEDEVIVGDTLSQAGPRSPFWSRFTVALGNDVFFKGFDVTAFLAGSLDIRQAPGTDPQARGEVVLRDGRYRGMGQDLQIDPGRLVFSGSLMHPSIEVLAFRRASDHTRAGFKVSGLLPDPQVDLYSDPMKPDNDITSYILFGRSSSEGSDTERMKASQAAALVGGNLLASTAAMQIGLDEARIDPGYTGNDAALVAGKYISPQLFVGYGQGLFETLHTLRVRYILSTHISLEAETGTRETADVIYQIERGE